MKFSDCYFPANLKMVECQEMVRRSNLSRIDMLRKASKDGCVCEGKWLQCASEIMVKNGLHINAFAKSIYVLL